MNVQKLYLRLQELRTAIKYLVLLDTLLKETASHSGKRKVEEAIVDTSIIASDLLHEMERLLK